MHPFLEIAAAVVFVASSGLFFNERFRRNYFAVGIAGLIATVSTTFLIREIGDRWFGAKPTSSPSGSVASLEARPTSLVTIRSLDQIGDILKTGSFDNLANIGSSRGVPTCYFEESGDTHRLDIGINKEGAFARLQEKSDSYGQPITVPPLRVFVGDRRVDENNKVTGDYFARVEYAKPIEYVRHRSGFMLLARKDGQSFFEFVAQARRQFIVVQSIEHQWSNEIVAVYHFDSRAVSSLMSCARTHLGFTQL